MILPDVKIVNQDRFNVVQTALINGVKYWVRHPSNNLRGVIFHKNVIIKFNDYDELNQNQMEYDRWLDMIEHPDFKQDKKHFAEILYFSPDCEYLIQRRYKFYSNISYNAKKKYYKHVQRLAQKYHLGADYEIQMHNWGITKAGILKIFDFGASFT